MARKILGTLKNKSGYKKLFNLPSGNNPGTPQSMCATSSSEFIVVHNVSNANVSCYLWRYNITGGTINRKLHKNKMTHGNGCAYLESVGLIAVKQNTNKVALFNAKTLEFSHYTTVDMNTQNIAYDRVNDNVVIHQSGKMWVYPVKKFVKGGSGKGTSAKISQEFESVNQDIGAYNGVAYVIHTPGKTESYIDAYNISSGKYLGSYHLPDINELESIDIINNNIYGCTANPRGFYKFDFKLLTGTSTAKSTGDDRKKFIEKYGNEARVYFGLRDLGYTHKGTCAMMGNINQESGFRTNAISYDGYGSVGICQWTFGRKTNLQNFAKKHDLDYLDINCQIKFLDYELKNSEKSAYNVVNNSSLSLKEMTTKFEETFERAGVPRMENRIKYAQTYNERYKGSFNGTGDPGDTGGTGENGYDIDFNVTTSKLATADNFNYIQQQKKEKSNNELVGESLGASFKNAFENLKKTNFNTTVPNIEPLLVSKNVFDNTPPKKSTFGGNVSGATLPIYKTIVEAPFVEIELNGVKFGTYNQSNKLPYPNYVQSLDITKTNGTLNEYVIRLIHQVEPGNNPNYIASLLSSVGFNKIKISYGDGNAGTYFSDVEALVTDVKTSFDFGNCNITYTIYASSLSYLTASNKMNFSAKTDKPSNVIIDLLKNNTSLIRDYFSGMTNIEKVLSNGLIPTNDAVVDISAVTNKTLVQYISYLVSLMKNQDSSIAEKSTYYLSINDNADKFVGNTFSIKEVTSDISKINELVYEVDLGYPDNNMVFNFSVNTNYGWAAAMETSSNITTYKYDINNSGDVVKSKSNALIKNTLNNSEFEIDSNTWKQLTRFPLTATLAVKGLMAPLMLLTYVKVNNYYYGNKRITSGLYIITEQKDSISGNGCRTTLGLTRVASDIESLTVDGRVKT